MKKSSLVLVLFILCAFTVFSQNPTVINGVATYTANKNIGRKFSVPNDWKKNYHQSQRNPYRELLHADAYNTY